MYFTGHFRFDFTRILLVFLCINFKENVCGRRERMRDYPRHSRSMVIQGVAESGNLFAEDLYEALTEQESSYENKNLVVSPLSIDIGLAMLRSGAGGLTKKEITRGLRINNDLTENEVHSGYKHIIRTLKEDPFSQSDMEDEEDKGVQIQLANRIFVGMLHTIKPNYLQKIRETFSADAEQVNFGNMQAAANTVNEWIREATQNKIRNIVVPTMFNNNTVMVLANAIHFKGNWKYPFDAQKNKPKSFTTVDGHHAQVEMMQLYNPQKLQYAKLPNLGASVVALPYSTQRFSFVIVLPDRGESLKDVEARLKDGMLASIPSELSQAYVDVRMPKMLLDSTIDLMESETIRKLRMTRMTIPEYAELDNLSDTKGVYISDVIHKAFIDVNEAGTEAAAATAIIATARSLETYEDVVKFTVDRPFLSFIYDAKTKTILFIARKLM